ncbi:MAG: activator of HSP90 ATPase 1 family protein [Phaeodactylibacter sp.]|nr:activator of HSP90 ATPase 1 family protein [Phaeodactylibacter sp.]
MERVSYTLEYLFRASPTILYQFFTTPSCLIRWFCDEVDIAGETYTFAWNGAEEVAFLVEDYEEEKLKFQWENADEDDEFLQISLERSPVTGETILTITDFCDEDELDDSKELWNSQIQALRRETGG